MQNRERMLVSESVAVIDIGSGSTKLLVTAAEGLSDMASCLAYGSVKTRLIAGDQRRISEDSLVATADAFDRFREIIDVHGPSKLAVVGTAAARAAVNIELLEKLVTETFGVDLEVLSGTREAELSYVGATSGRAVDGPVSVMDIGAGSTEFATKNDDDSIASWSLPVGGRTLTDDYLESDPCRPEELSSALTVMEFHLDDLHRELPVLADAIADGTVIAVGAMSQIARVEIGSQDPDFVVDGEVIEKVGIEEVFRILATESAEERAFNPGLELVHVDDIVGALCVLVGFMRYYSVPEVMVSGRSLMHGLAAELLSEG